MADHRGPPSAAVSARETQPTVIPIGIAPPSIRAEGVAAEGSGSRRPPGIDGGPPVETGSGKWGRVLPGFAWDDYGCPAVVLNLFLLFGGSHRQVNGRIEKG